MFCDQAYWQSSVAAKPLQGVWGFITGGLVWFAIPFTLATTMGLAYLGLSSAQGAPMLTEDDVMKGEAVRQDNYTITLSVRSCSTLGGSEAARDDW